jgi:hypothetical protein
MVLNTWARSHGAFVFGSGVKLKVAPRKGRMPDLAIYLSGARRPALRGLVEAPPSIAIEVVSATPGDERRDRVEKLREYLELDDQGRYVHMIAATEGVIGSVPGCEGLGIGVSALWAEVDALLAEEHE